MRIFYIAIIFIVIASSSCTTSGTKQESGILNQELLGAYRDYDSTNRLERSALLFDNGESANNCISYHELSSRYPLEESIHNQMVKSEYLICDAIRIISESRSTNRVTSDSNYGERLSLNLDLRSFPSSLSRIGDQTSNTLFSLFPTEITTNENVVHYNSGEWNFRLEVVAEVHIDENNTPDWIVWVSDEAKFGNYRAYSSIIIYDPSDESHYVATVYPPL